MPSRFGVALIATFWLATTGFVAYRDVLPRYFSDGPPPIRIDLTDEATQRQARWMLYRETADGTFAKVGALSTELEYVPEDDTFWFRNEYADLKLDVGVVGAAVRFHIPKANSDVRVTRLGRLREQRMTGELRVSLQVGALPLWTDIGTGTAELTARVVGDRLTGRVKVSSEFGDETRDLPAVPTADGQVLSPMMPVARLQGVRPGRRWVIREGDPLKESIRILARELAEKAKLPAAITGAAEAEAVELIAEVRSSPEPLVPFKPEQQPPKGEPIPCWVIDYRGAGDVRAATWVGVSDGRVYRQEASGFGEKLRFEREY